MIYKLAYCRKSTESDERQIQSIESQMSWLRGVLGSEFDKVTLFSESKSAKAPDQRKEFKNLIKEIDKINKKAKGEYEIHIYTWALDRISRNPIDSGIIQYYMQIGKLHKIVCSDKVYNPEDSGIFMGMINAMSNQYILDLRKNVNRGMLDKIKKGGCVIKTPNGYVNNPKSREADVDPIRKPIIQKIFRLRDEGFTVSSIVDICKDEGYKTKTGNDFSKTVIENLLKNTFYIGYQYFKGELWESNHETFISKALFNRINDKPKKHFKPIELDKAPLKGIIKDKETGRILTASIKKKTLKSGEIKEYIYYHTHYRDEINISISQDEIIKHFDNIIHLYEVTEKSRQLIKKVVKKVFDNEFEELSEQRKSLNRKIAECNKKSQRMFQLICEEIITKEKYKKENFDNKTLLELYKEQLAGLDKKDDGLINQISNFVELFENLSDKRKTWSNNKKLSFMVMMSVELFVTTKKDLYIAENELFNTIKGLEGLNWWIDRGSNPGPIA